MPHVPCHVPMSLATELFFFFFVANPENYLHQNIKVRLKVFFVIWEEGAE